MIFYGYNVDVFPLFVFFGSLHITIYMYNSCTCTCNNAVLTKDPRWLKQLHESKVTCSAWEIQSAFGDIIILIIN